MSQPFEINVSEGIAEMILDHPPVNAFDSDGWFAIAAQIDALGERDDVRVIIIAARGKGFCAGVDIKELASDKSKIVEVNKGNYETFRAIHLNPKPVILALHSFVLGGGIGMAGAADFLIASECTRFGVPEIDRGGDGRWGTLAASLSSTENALHILYREVYRCAGSVSIRCHRAGCAA